MQKFHFLQCCNYIKGAGSVLDITFNKFGQIFNNFSALTLQVTEKPKTYHHC